MSPTSDRSIRDNSLLIGVIIGLALIAAGGYYFLTRINVDADRKPVEQEASSLIQPAFKNEPLSVALYYPAEGMLVAGTTPAKRQPDTQAQARETLMAMLQDQRAAQAPVLKDVKLRAFYIGPQGTAYVDLAPAAQAVRASAWDEQLAVYALVDTLMQNFEEIKQVVFLVDGRDAQTLAGHIDLSRKYVKRMDLVKQ